MLIIFLDIDGVLNNTCDLVVNKNITSRVVDRNKVKLLKLVLDQVKRETGEMPYLVLTSTWRRVYSFVELNHLFDCEMPWFGKTPDLGNRSDEITYFLNYHEVDNYVVIDDHEITGHKNFVRTSSFYGLSTPEANAILRFFNCKEHFIGII